MANPPLHEQKGQRLVELWNHIASLTEKEWGELYTLCHFFVVQYKTFEEIKTYFKTLDEDPDALFAQFFLQKVLEPSDVGRTPCPIKHIGAVRSFFYRFLVDQGRTQNRRPSSDASIGTEAENAEDDGYTRKFIDTPTTMTDDSIEQLVNTTQHPVEYFIQAGKTFLASLTEDEQLLLRCSLDPDLATSRLAAHYGIASYASKAKKLGITKITRGARSANNATLLMQWFIHLELNPPEEYIDEIHGLLKILAEVSLNITVLDQSLLPNDNNEGQTS